MRADGKDKRNRIQTQQCKSETREKKKSFIGFLPLQHTKDHISYQSTQQKENIEHCTIYNHRHSQKYREKRNQTKKKRRETPWRVLMSEKIHSREANTLRWWLKAAAKLFEYYSIFVHRNNRFPIWWWLKIRHDVVKGGITQTKRI